MPRPLPTAAALLLAACCVCACAAAAKNDPPGSAILSEPVAPQSTGYVFEYACPHPFVVRIAGDSRWREGGGYASRITALSIASADVAKESLARINDRFPADALQERPWVTCLERSAKVEIRMVDRSTGGVSRDAKLIFLLRDDGTIEFR